MVIMFTIEPYWQHNAWVFDDKRVGLLAEPLVGNINMMVDRMLIEKTKGAHSPESRAHALKIHRETPNFRLTFTDTAPADNNALKLNLLRTDASGSDYYCSKYNLEGWLCPALFLYYPKAPKSIYATVMLTS